MQFLAYSATYPGDLKGRIEKLMVHANFVDAVQKEGKDGSDETEDSKNEERDLNLENIV